MSAKTYYSDTRPATNRQRAYMQERSIQFSENITVAQASERITEYQDAGGDNEENHIMDIDQ